MSEKKVGRPVGWRKENPQSRPLRTLRAFDDEWALIKEFMLIVRERDKEKIAAALKFLKDFS